MMISNDENGPAFMHKYRFQVLRLVTGRFMHPERGGLCVTCNRQDDSAPWPAPRGSKSEKA